MNPPLETDWEREHRILDDYELDADGMPVYVKKIEPEYQPNFLRIESEKNTDDGIRLDTYEAGRIRTLTRISNDLGTALLNAESGKRGARSIGLLPMVIDKIDDMIAAGHEALDLIAMLEEQ